MDYSLVMHVDQPPSDFNKLQPSLDPQRQQNARKLGNKTYKSQPIRIDMRFRKLLNVTFHHPLRYHHKSILCHRHTYQWQHVWMVKALPCHNFPAEPLHETRLVRQIHIQGREHQQHTFLIRSRLLVWYTLNTLAATSRPWYLPFHTSANPP